MPAKYNNWAGKGKHWDIPDNEIGRVGIRRVNENIWFCDQQGFLRWLANSDSGRDLLRIPKEYGKIIALRKNSLTFDNGFGQKVSDFRIGAKWGNIMRSHWKEVQEAYRIYERERFSAMGWKPAWFPLAPVGQFSYTDSTFYPDPNPETTSVDGSLTWGVASYVNWATAHGANGSSDTTADDTATRDNDSVNSYFLRVIGRATNLYQRIQRNVYSFDTSAISDTDTVTAATFTLFGDGGPEIDELTGGGCGVCQAYTANATSLVAGDFNIANWNTNAWATYKTWSAFDSTAGGQNDFAFNATGYGAISKTGLTKVGCLEEFDRTNTDPTSSTTKQSGGSARFADYAGTTSDPKLVVVHAGASAAIKDIISMGLLFPR